MSTADTLDVVVLLGSEGGQALLIFNSSLVCRLVLDHEFGCIALAGCHVLQLSLQHYQDDQLPCSPGPLVTCTYVYPLLFALTASGIVCILTLHVQLIYIHCYVLVIVAYAVASATYLIFIYPCNYNISAIFS